MAREGLLNNAPSWCAGLVSVLADYAISIEIHDKLLTTAIIMLAPRGDAERLSELHRSLVNLYMPDADFGRPGSDLEEMKRRFDEIPDLIKINRH